MAQEKIQQKKGKSSKFVAHTIIYPIEPDVIDEEITSVRLIGEFGTWSGWIDMKKSEDGQSYQTNVFVHPGTTICYKYLINGHIWSTDLSPETKSIKGEDGHLMVVKKVGDDGSSVKDSVSIQFEDNLEIIDESDSSSIDNNSQLSKSNDQKEIPEKKQQSTDINKVSKPKKEKKTPGCFKRLFSCF